MVSSCTQSLLLSLPRDHNQIMSPIFVLKMLDKVANAPIFSKLAREPGPLPRLKPLGGSPVQADNPGYVAAGIGNFRKEVSYKQNLMQQLITHWNAEYA